LKVFSKTFGRSFLVFSTLLTTGSLSAAQALTLKDVLKEAQQKNPSLQSAQLAVQAAEEGESLANVGFWPSLNAVASANESQTQALGNLPSLGLLQGQSSSGEGYSGGLQASWNLFDGFATLAARQQSQHLLAQRKAAYALSSSLLLLNLSQAFDQLIYDQKNQALLEDLAVRYSQDTRYQSLEFASGHTPRWTYLKAQSDEAALKWELRQNALATRSDQANLAALMGRDISEASSIILKGELDVIAPPDDDQVDLQRVAKEHPSLLEQEALVLSSEAARDESLASRYPSLDASGSYGVSASNFNSPSQSQALAGLTLKFNLFSGGAQEAAIKQADLSLQASRQDLEQLRIQIQASLHKAWTSFLSDYERLPVIHLATAAGEERFKTVQKLYEAGRAAFLDYEQAESIYTQAQQQELTETRAATQAQAAYENAMGRGIEWALASGDEGGALGENSH
jgi:outer membrane protein TolC